MTRSENIATTNSSNPDVVLIGAGIMSATLAVILKELDPKLKIEIHEVLGTEAQESSNAWNNAGTAYWFTVSCTQVSMPWPDPEFRSYAT
jgi:malate dehydrogenase (quinone)